MNNGLLIHVGMKSIEAVFDDALEIAIDSWIGWENLGGTAKSMRTQRLPPPIRPCSHAVNTLPKRRGIVYWIFWLKNLGASGIWIEHTITEIRNSGAKANMQIQWGQKVQRKRKCREDPDLQRINSWSVNFHEREYESVYGGSNSGIRA